MIKNLMIVSLWMLIFFANTCSAQSKNGFNLQNSLLPANQIFSGGPGKDGIPAIDKPTFVTAQKADFLDDDSAVLGIHYKGLSKAYPINILNWHEVVNDQFEGEAVVITFCPLCGSGMAFSAAILGVEHTFGVSGLLYNSDVLLYDRQTQSLWSQLMRQAISGPLKGEKLKSLPVLHTTWQDWQEKFPNTQVLSTATGFKRNYSHSPYADYINSPQVMFPVTSESRRYHPKEQVYGLEIAGQFKAYPFIELEKSPATFTDTVDGQLVTIRYNHRQKSVVVLDRQGRQLAGVRVYWFAWYAFHPNTQIYTSQ